MDPIASKITEHVADQSLQQGAGGASPGKVDAGDQAQFENALNGEQNAGVQSVGPADVQVQLEQVNGVEGGAVEKPSLGDSILDGLEKLKTNFDARTDRIEQSIVNSGGDMTMEDMMKLQFEVMQMGIEQDLTTKMADKTSSGVQTMFRNQG